jgi:hypothetical protein
MQLGNAYREKVECEGWSARFPQTDVIAPFELSLSISSLITADPG